MLRKLPPVAWMAFILIALTGFSGIAWKNNQDAITTRMQQDTTPKKEDETVIDGDLDRALEEVHRATENLERQMKKMDWKKMNRDMSESLEKINSTRIHEEIARAMRNINREQIELKTREALRKIDWKKMHQELDRANDAFSEKDRVKMKEGTQRAMEETRRAMERMKSIDSKEMRREMERAMERIWDHEGDIKENMEKARKNGLKYLGDDFERKMEKAREKVKRAGEALQNYKEMVNEMDKDGLIKIKETYTIEYKNEELFINGAKQPSSVADKYKHYFKNGRVTIKKDKDDDHRTIYL